MPACAGMTEPRGLFVVHIIPSQVFSKEARRTRRFRIKVILNFVLFVFSFENTCEGMICTTKSLRGSVIPAKAGIQANSAQNKPGFPRARE